MKVTRVLEAPRVTKPYTDAQWAEIERLGHRVDADLRANDVRLTMGGEPTFVSLDDRDGAEWNTEAMGPEQAQAGFGSAEETESEVRAEGPAPPRPGQVVPRRAAAALVAVVLLAQGRRAGVAERRAVRRRKRELRRHAGAGGAVPQDAGREARRRSEARLPRLRGHLVLPVARAPAAVERRSVRRQARRPARARAPAQGIQAGPRQGGRPRPAAEEEPGALGERRLVPARRALLPRARRLADGPAPAARLDSLGREGRPAVPHRAGSDAAVFAFAFLSESCRRPNPPGRQRLATGGQHPSSPPRGSPAPPCAPSRATACSTSSCRRPNRSRTTSRSSARSRPPPASSASRWCSRATSRRRTRAWSRSASRPTRACSRSTSSRRRAGASWCPTPSSSTTASRSAAARTATCSSTT